MAGNDAFTLGTKAKELMLHTMQVTSNSKVFPKRLRLSLCDKMINTAISILEGVTRANETDIRTDPDERLHEQKQVLVDCVLLETMISVALETPTVGIDARRAEYWTKLVLTVRYMCAGWHKKDKYRAAELTNQGARRPGPPSH